MSRQFYLRPWKLYHALTVCQPIFQKLFRTLHMYHAFTVCQPIFQKLFRTLHMYK